MRNPRVRRAARAFRGGGNFGTRVALTAGTNLVLGVLAVLTGTIAARLLGPQGRGELAAIQLWPHVLMVISALGLSEALVYFSARDADDSGHYVASATTLSCISAVSFAALGYVFMPVVLSAQQEGTIDAARWYLVAVPIAILGGIPTHALRGRNDFLAWNGLRVLPNIGWLIVLIGFALFAVPRPTGLAAGYLFILILLIVPFWSVVIRRVPGPFRPRIGDWSPMLRYGLPSAASRVPYVVNFRLDQIALASLFSPRVLGLYVVATGWGTLAQPLITPLGTALFPEIASKDPATEQAHVFAQGARAAVTLAGVLCVSVLAITPWALPLLFGSDFAAAIPAAMILVPVGVLVGLNLVLAEGLMGLGHPKSVMLADLAGIIVTGVMLLLLLRPIGMIGAASSSLIGQATVTIGLFRSARKTTNLQIARFARPDLALLSKGIRSVVSGRAWPNEKSHGEVTQDIYPLG